MTGRQRYDHHLATIGDDIAGANDSFHGVIPSLYEYIWCQRTNELERRVRIEHHDRID